MGQPVEAKDPVKVDLPSLKEKTSEKTEKIELYDFGHAPLEVIKAFQEFCKPHTSLADALMAILEREPLLKKKYKFIIRPVSYQMLARPTPNDTEKGMVKVIRSLQSYTRRSKYDKIANAIEELLFSPNCAQVTCCDKSTWTNGNVGSNYKEVSYPEQIVLEQIADTLLNRLSSTIQKPTKRRSYARKDAKPPAKKMKQSTATDAPFYPHLNNIYFKPIQVVLKTSQSQSEVKHKPQNTHKCLNPSGSSSGVNGIHREIADAEVAMPAQNFLPSKRFHLQKGKPDISVFTMRKKVPNKVQFLRGFLDLVPNVKSKK